MSDASHPKSPLDQSGSRIDMKVDDHSSNQPPEADKEDEQLPKREVQEGGEEDERDEEEPGECGFCLYMKAGGCRDSFITWENCIAEAVKNKEDVNYKCMEITGALIKCMEAHADYYDPFLKAGKVAEQEAIMELEKETAASQNPDSEDVVDHTNLMWI